MELSKLSYLDIGVIATLLLTLILVIFLFATRISLITKVNDNIDQTLKLRMTAGDGIALHFCETEFTSLFGRVAVKSDLSDAQMKKVKADVIITSLAPTRVRGSSDEFESVAACNIRIYNKTGRDIYINNISIQPLVEDGLTFGNSLSNTFFSDKVLVASDFTTLAANTIFRGEEKLLNDFVMRIAITTSTVTDKKSKITM